jgi:mono/diheme cytochrome c family protein
MNRLKTGHLIFALAFMLCVAAFARPDSPQEPQAPRTQNSADQKPPPKEPCADKSTGKPCAEKPEGGFDLQEALRDFMALGKVPDPDSVKRGQAIYVPTCGFCHGSAGRGGSSGPSLVRSVLVLHDQGTGMEITPVVRNGRADKGMPPFPQLQEGQVKDIAAFLLSLIQANANRNDYKILNIVTGDSAKGEAYFKNRCANCHSPTGDLAHIASKFEPVALQSRFLYPKTDWYPGMQPRNPEEVSTATVKLPSGQTFSGKVDRLDDFRITITDSAGQHHTWSLDTEPKISVEINDPLKAHFEMLRQWTDDDMHNMLAYLETLK